MCPDQAPAGRKLCTLTLSIFETFTDFFCERGPIFSPPSVTGAGICSFRAGFDLPVPQPVPGALFSASTGAYNPKSVRFYLRMFLSCHCLLFLTQDTFLITLLTKVCSDYFVPLPDGQRLLSWGCSNLLGRLVMHLEVTLGSGFHLSGGHYARMTQGRARTNLC